MIYAAAVTPTLRQLKALDAILAKTEVQCAARKIDPAVLLRDRLYPDMLDLTRQVQLACDFAARMAARLSDSDVPTFPDTETTLHDLRARIASAMASIASAPEAAFEGAAERPVTIKARGQDMTMTGLEFLTLYALPQFYFHATTAYAILRHNGIEIGKADFMGIA